MATDQEVGRAGEAHVVEQLQGRRFKIQAWDSTSPSAANIEALGGKRHVLVQVKTSMSPNDPQFLSGEEATAMKVRALLLGAEAWQARVTMNDDLTLKGKIAWRRVR
ncbi:MAG: hypothetical protein LAO05_16410 [Acidobacteriia bacterium]|nr:hypothetical protein [Terriglobia bacterium]